MFSRRILYNFTVTYFPFIVVLLFRLRGLFLKSSEDRFFLERDGSRFYFFNLYRSRLYFFGLENRFSNLLSSYYVDKCNLETGDIVIDCGANIGEFALALCNRYDLKVYCFEPSITPFKCLEKNVASIPSIVAINAGLGTSDTHMILYDKPASADSSFIDPGGASEILTKVVSGQSFFSEYNIGNIKLLKVEAEGYEPEVLEGFKNVLPCIDYISVEMSNERGLSNDFTICDCVNYLLGNGFKMVEFSPSRFVGLFVNANRLAD